MPLRKLILAFSLVWTSGVLSSRAQDPTTSAPARRSLLSEPGPLLRADIRLDKFILQSGQPVWAELSLTNLTDSPMSLQVPEAQSKEAAGTMEMGLPFSHVFSGKGFSALNIRDHRGDQLDTQVSRKPVQPAPVVHLAAHGSVGTRLDLTQYYEALLRRPGKYTLIWRPYGGTVESEPVTVTLLAEQQAIILTDYGRMVIRFYYEQAPRHVQNFIELVNQRFYDDVTFHRVVAGSIIQGGDKRGDGRGLRPDGVRLQAEFSNIPFEAGTVGMARSPRDPDSASCQFFICLSRQPTFDGDQTAFGYLVGQESFDTLNKIGAVPTGPKDRPLKPVFIRTISLENVPDRYRESLSGAGSSSSSGVMVQRDLEPSRNAYRPEPAPTGPDISPPRRLSRLSRLLAATQPAGQSSD